MSYENSPKAAENVNELEALGVEHDSTRSLPVLTVLFGALALMAGTIIVATPGVLKVSQGLIQERQMNVATPDIDALRATETEALSTPKKLDNGLYRIPIGAAKAALIANPMLLASAGEAPAPAAAADDGGADAAADMSEEELAAAGKELFNGPKICMSCHKQDSADRLVGPGLKGIFGREEKMADGTTIIVDEAYLIESLKEPNAKVVDTYPPAMTPQTFTDLELKQLVAYLKTL